MDELIQANKGNLKSEELKAAIGELLEGLEGDPSRHALEVYTHLQHHISIGDLENIHETNEVPETEEIAQD